MAKTTTRPIMTSGTVMLPLFLEEESLAPGRVWVGLVGMASEAEPLGSMEEDSGGAEELSDGLLVELSEVLEESEVSGANVLSLSLSFTVWESYSSR